ncbi:MAG: DNA-3-methyladenine glycosylase [Actinomycetota bacterium]|nr:DNA-3-methyladenine glycosylase [Actinomycetota bacterium]
MFEAGSRLSKDFFERPTIEVARNLLGSVLRHETLVGVSSGIIIETEAYLGECDKASHARFGNKGRGRIMFGPPGFAYVYLIYGMHSMFNVVTEPSGIAGAVLIRALEPLEGIDIMMSRRAKENEKLLTSGPARLACALGITLEHNGCDLTHGPLGIWGYKSFSNREISNTPRIGVSGWKDKPWRFFVENKD